MFNYHKGYLSVNFSDNYYFLSQRHEEVPRLTPAHLEVRGAGALGRPQRRVERRGGGKQWVCGQGLGARRLLGWGGRVGEGAAKSSAQQGDSAYCRTQFMDLHAS